MSDIEPTKRFVNLGTATEESYDLTDKLLGKRPGVTCTFLDEEGNRQHLGYDLIDMDFYVAVQEENGDWTIRLEKDEALELCRTKYTDFAQVLVEGLNMRAEHYGLRAYGRMHGELPTQQVLRRQNEVIDTLHKKINVLEAKNKQLEGERNEYKQLASGHTGRVEGISGDPETSRDVRFSEFLDQCEAECGDTIEGFIEKKMAPSDTGMACALPGGDGKKSSKPASKTKKARFWKRNVQAND